MKAYEAIAACFVKEGCVTHFSLMGDGNMHFTVSLAGREGVRTIYTRHEHSACAMASAHAVRTGGVGVASVTFGPGISQISTALCTAVQARIPLVVFTGEIPTDVSFHNQRSNQAALVMATGAHYLPMVHNTRLQEHVREAFYIAHTEQRPVVLACPHDMQMQEVDFDEDAYTPSTAFLPHTGRMPPDLESVVRVAELIEKSSRIVIIGGLGAKRAGAAADCIMLAGKTQAYLATTLPARGLFEGAPFSLGIAGGYASEPARQIFDQCDLVIAVGASLTHFTVAGGHLCRNARIVQIDVAPQGLRDGRRVADLHICADACAGVRAILSVLEERGTERGAVWTRTEVPTFNVIPCDDPQVEAGNLLHPSYAVEALNQAIPHDWEFVNATGHCAYFSAQMRGRPAQRFMTIREFGAIGNGICHAAGVAAADPQRPVVLIDGDGGFLMHVQELDTLMRHNLRILICILNDGAFGPEIHKLRAQGLDEGGAIYGRGDLGRIGEGFGLKGAVVTSEQEIKEVVERFQSDRCSYIMDIHISDKVIAPDMERRLRQYHRTQGR